MLLNSSPTKISKEPRPVYAPELDLLGFDQYWNYDKQTDAPYMWAEANRYWYRGRPVASLKGGNVYNAPEIQLAYVCREWRETPNGKTIEKTVFENSNTGDTFTDKKDNVFVINPPEPDGGRLRPVNITAMIEANREMLEIIEATTVKKILAIYEKYADKLDIFHVAFSGGKDSCVLLDLCKKTLPKDSFVVVFGDTMMEFPDTYDLIDKIEEECKRDDIKFYRAYSHLRPEVSWELFGPPSRTLRWCCSVHKSTPQTLKLREITGKQDYTGLAYVGVRAEESATRSEYEYENYGKKQKGQHSHNSILEWTSAEVWLYIYANNLIINEAYKKGSQRVGCICCPMGSGGKSSYVEFENYKNIVNIYFDIIKKSNGRKSVSIEELINNGGWSARKNGRDIADNPSHCNEIIEDGYLTITIINPSSDWREWIKTINIDPNIINITENKAGFNVKISEIYTKKNPLMGRLIRQVFHKASYCMECRVCETNCPNGCIEFENKKIGINGCVQCGECHEIETGCVLYHSLRQPQGGGKIMKSLNTMSNHAPKTEWFTAFFAKKEDFFADHGLGPEQISFFKRFLKDAGLTEKTALTLFANLILDIGWDTDTALGLVLINLANENPQIDWYIKNLEVGKTYARKTVEDMLINFDIKPPVAKSMCGAFKRLTETPFGTKLNWGYVSESGDISRTVCNVSDPRVILYGLYIYNEKANAHYEFRLNSFYENVEQDGIPPTCIFGLDRQTVEPMLRWLSANYNDFINYSDTNDLCKISLREDKTPDDVLDLFREVK